MKRAKRFVSLILAVGLCFSTLAGCSGGNQTSAPKTASAVGESETPAKSVKLVWALWDAAKTTYYEPLIEEFQKENPNIMIEMKDLGSTDYQTALGTQLAGGDSGIDLVTVKDIPGYTSMTNAGQLQDLTQDIKDSNIDTSLYGGITEQITVNGKLYALPFRSDFWLVYYNKDLFDKAKISYPTNDMTVEQYDQLARKMTSGNGNGKVYGAHYHTWRSAVQLFGILDGKHTIYDYQDNYSWMKPYYQIVLKEQDDGICQKYATLKTSSISYSGVFENSTIAMMNMGSWFIATLMADIKAGKTQVKHFGLAKYPHPDGVKAGTTLGTITSLAVSSASQHKTESLKFLNFVTGEKGAEIIAKTGNLPAIKNDAVVNAISKMDGFPDDDNSKEALKTVKTYLEMPINSKSAEIDIALNDDHDAIMTKSVSIDDGLKKMSEDIKKIVGK